MQSRQKQTKPKKKKTRENVKSLLLLWLLEISDHRTNQTKAETGKELIEILVLFLHKSSLIINACCSDKVVLRWFTRWAFQFHFLITYYSQSFQLYCSHHSSFFFFFYLSEFLSSAFASASALYLCNCELLFLYVCFFSVIFVFSVSKSLSLR